MAKTKINYDEKIMSQADYQKLLGYKQDWANAATDAGRQKAHSNAEALRAGYGYSMGADGSQFSLLSGLEVSDTTGMGLLEQQKGPASYEDQYQALYQQMAQREPFSYDPDTDPVYQSLATQYQTQGQQAMTDTMAQAAGLTGGYGSSYAQSAGQQAYQNSLSQLAALLPQLMQLAQKSYSMQTDSLRDRGELLQSMQDDARDRYDSQLDYWLGMADREQKTAHQATDAAAERRRAAWDKAMDSIALGVVPAADVLSAAGLSTAWAQNMAAMARFKIYK